MLHCMLASSSDIVLQARRNSAAHVPPAPLPPQHTHTIITTLKFCTHLRETHERALCDVHPVHCYRLELRCTSPPLSHWW